jgi:hypothetical protein
VEAGARDLAAVPCATRIHQDSASAGQTLNLGAGLNASPTRVGVTE